ncbi:platelet glycoprotein VI-like [Antechinus flavipes]|uniref:platelet glycoprotein VI-like n=1 Tax=Antechinus flavipes TaxID=38775 RepID=UPI00223614D6|nr:platelet glycoprotein VI-like [Antechinus flavipes]
MEPRLLLLLWLGLSARIQAVYFKVPSPEMRIRPHNILPVGSPVTISCYTPMIADYFRLIRLDFLEEGIAGDEIPSIYPGHEVHMYHPAIRPEHAARYYCQYRLSEFWSFPSSYMDLIISGFYSSPHLVMTPTKVKEGGSVSVKCTTGGERLIIWNLIKGVTDFRGYVTSAVDLQLEETLSNLKPSQSGQYACYGNNGTHQRLWSLPSNLVTLTVGEQRASAPRAARGTHVSRVFLALLLLQSRWM